MTLYEILGLKTDSSEDEIQSMYSKLLAQYSRDAASGDKALAEKKIADLKYAKKILLDPNERKNYDAALQADLNGNSKRVKISLEKRQVHRNTDANTIEQETVPQNIPASTQTQPVKITEKLDQTISESKLTTGYIITNAIVFAVLVVAILIINNLIGKQ